MTCFTAIFALLQWPGTEPTTSLRCHCMTVVQGKSHQQGLSGGRGSGVQRQMQVTGGFPSCWKHRGTTHQHHAMQSFQFQLGCPGPYTILMEGASQPNSISFTIHHRKSTVNSSTSTFTVTGNVSPRATNIKHCCKFYTKIALGSRFFMRFYFLLIEPWCKKFEK